MSERKHRMIKQIAREAVKNGCKLETGDLIKMFKVEHAKLNHVERGDPDVAFMLMTKAALPEPTRE